MGFSTRAGIGFPFAPKCATLALYALISSTLHASVVPLSWSGNRADATVLTVAEETLRETEEVTSLLAINTCRVGDSSLFDPGLGKILQDAGALSGSGEPMRLGSRFLSGFGSNDLGPASAHAIPEFRDGIFADSPGIGVARFSPNGAAGDADIAGFGAHRGVDLWSSGGGNVPPPNDPVTYTSVRTFNPGTFATQSSTAIAFLDSAGSPMPEAIDSIFTWDGGGADNNVTTAQNWVGDTPPGANSDIIFAGTTRLNVNVDIGGPARTWTFDNTAGAFVISGAAFSISDGITNNSTATQTINNAITLTLAQTWSAVSGNLVFGGNLANGGFLLTIGGSANTSASGILSGTGGLTKTGTGRLTLSGANTYTGTTTVSAGVLNIQNATGLGTTAAGTTVTSGAALQLQGGIAVGNEALTLNGTGIGSDGALRNISGNNSWAGTITINSTTRINSDSGTLTLDVASGNAITGSNDNLEFGGTGYVTVNDVIATGTGTLTKDGTGLLTLNAVNTYTGATTVNAGVLNIRNATGLGTIAGGTTVSNGATLQLQGGITIGSEALNIRGIGAAGQNGALVNVSGTNNYGGLLTLSGATTLSSNSGILNLTNTGTITGATFGLTLTGTGNGSISSIIGTTTGSLAKSGTGTWTLLGANTFTGATTVNGGTLSLSNGSGSALGFTSGITVNSGATLFLGADNQINNLAQITLAGGTFRRGNFSEGTAGSAGVGALSLTAGGSHLDFGTGLVGILTFASFAAGGNTLIIDNWSGTSATLGTSGLTDRLIFASNQSGNLGNFNFTGFGLGAVQFDLGNGYFEIVPVPEAETCFSVSLVLALILLHHRRQLGQLVERWRASRRLRFSATHGTGVAS
jgi:autotransporter-associated beta strand protein